MTTRAAPMCVSCVRLRSGDDSPGRCAAFPGGIPEAIWFRLGDHRVPVAGDNGLQFRSATGDPPNPAIWPPLPKAPTSP